jgi:rare lipoprotein A
MRRTFGLLALLVLGWNGLAAQSLPDQAAAAGPEAPAQAAPFVQEGVASWYGAEFEGRPTASGEIFSAARLTAAHPTLPFGTVLRVTNRQNGKTTVVRVNDRGPFVAARIIDLSKAAAEQLDMLATGTAPVRVETVGPAAPDAAPAPAPAPVAPVPAAPAAAPVPAPAPQAAPAAAPVPALLAPTPRPAVFLPKMPDPNNGKRYRIQVGSYKLVRNATEAFDRLREVGLAPAYEKYGDLYRVVLVGVAAGALQDTAALIGKAGFAEALLREEN